MTYKEYPDCTKTYIVVHQTGFGVMEAPYVEKEVVYETNSQGHAHRKAEEFTKERNPDYGKTSWLNHTYIVNINILTKKGALLHKQFGKEFDERWKEGKKRGDKAYKVGQYTFLVAPHPAFDEPSKPEAFPNRIIWSEPKK